jgi:hypothetical protein
MPNEILEDAAQKYERAAAELERGAQHLRIAAAHMREHEVPRACAHAFATIGHLAISKLLLDDLAVLHSTKANV